jgi:uncharacterized protein (UPF0261 family)
LKDIVLIPSVVDVAGLNTIILPIINQAAAAIVAMSRVEKEISHQNKGSIAISMFGNTTDCVNLCTTLLQEKAYEVMAFHANGSGGKAMEALIREGCFDGVLDLTTTELADEYCGGILSAGPERLICSCGNEPAPGGGTRMSGHGQFWNPGSSVPEKVRGTGFFINGHRM